jgi:hypothetical protein
MGDAPDLRNRLLVVSTFFLGQHLVAVGHVDRNIWRRMCESWGQGADSCQTPLFFWGFRIRVARNNKSKKNQAGFNGSARSSPAPFSTSAVMPGLGPGIHDFSSPAEDVDGRVRSGHDKGRAKTRGEIASWIPARPTGVGNDNGDVNRLAPARSSLAPFSAPPCRNRP